MSLPPDAKRAYGLVAAVGTKLGERARTEPGLVDAVRATPTADALRELLREKSAGILPDAVLAQFLDVLRDDQWTQWRARLLLQMKLTRDGGKPAPGHEQGRGVGRP